jgi:type IV secretory pathway VirB4 component
MAKKTTTQHLVPITNIRDDVVILNDGQMCTVLLATSINFALKSADEQQAILSQFQAFLNSLDFSLQIYSQSRRLDIRPYLEILKEREPHQDNDLMKIQLREYMEFIRTFTEQVDIMSKNFFVVVPFSPATIEVKGISKLLKTGNAGDEAAEEARFIENKIQLEQRIAVVEQGLARIGIRTALLNTEQLTELYYHIFNPEDLSTPPKQ